MDLTAFFKAEFAEHHDTVRRTEAALAGAFAGLVGACVKSIRGGGKLMFFGNGGSAADAQHLATELTVRYKTDRAAIAAIALTTDTSALTSAGNDFDFGQESQHYRGAAAGQGDEAGDGGAGRQRRRRSSRACRSSAGGAVRHHGAGPGNAHRPRPDALRRHGDRAGADQTRCLDALVTANPLRGRLFYIFMTRNQRSPY